MAERKVMQAEAIIEGSSKYPNLQGRVHFYQLKEGVAVAAEMWGLPVTDGSRTGGETPQGIFAFHIHEGERCSGNGADPFADAGGHFNPAKTMHPYHAGDMPPLFGRGENEGYAQMLFVTDRFTLDEVAGKTVIVHAQPDDFTTQPSGNAGEKIGCGVIVAAE